MSRPAAVTGAISTSILAKDGNRPQPIARFRGWLPMTRLLSGRN